MKSVLASIKPRYCELIAIGQKTLEIRKSKPKLDTPFKCYIYQTKKKWWYKLLEPFRSFAWAQALMEGQAKVIGEFICDRIYQYTTSNCTEGMDTTTEEVTRMSCLTKQELEAYEFSAEPKDFCLYMVGLYCWHISNLKIYDKPKELSEFNGIKTMRNGFEVRLLERPPQSWCYVEGF